MSPIVTRKATDEEQREALERAVGHTPLGVEVKGDSSLPEAKLQQDLLLHKAELVGQLAALPEMKKTIMRKIRAIEILLEP